MVRIMLGQGRRMMRKPSRSLPTSIAVEIDDIGNDAGHRQRARAGFQPAPRRAWAQIMMPPVSVCHQVSTMGQRPLPMTR